MHWGHHHFQTVLNLVHWKNLHYGVSHYGDSEIQAQFYVCLVNLGNNCDVKCVLRYASFNSAWICCCPLWGGCCLQVWARCGCQQSYSIITTSMFLVLCSSWGKIPPLLYFSSWSCHWIAWNKSENGGRQRTHAGQHSVTVRRDIEGRWGFLVNSLYW